MSPSDESVEYEETYAVTCSSGYTISGTITMTCQDDGMFDQTPTCEQGKLKALKNLHFNI